MPVYMRAALIRRGMPVISEAVQSKEAEITGCLYAGRAAAHALWRRVRPAVFT